MSNFDFSKFSGKAHVNNRYEKRIDALKAKGRQTDCIEKAVEGAISNIKQGDTRSFVIYGEPQSGKTEMMIALTARLLDEGKKIIIHLLNDNVSLLEQNLYRFQESGLAPSPCGFAEILDPVIVIGDREWVIFCKKNVSNLTKLMQKIGHIDGKVIIDDEADYASPNAKVNKGEKTKINKLIGDLLRNTGIYIGVTATPARLDLNNTFENDHEKWVDFPAHTKYTGQNTFFPIKESTDFKITFVPDTAGDDPKWCRDALFGFLTNVAYLNLHPEIHDGPKNYSFLVHTSGQKADHKKDYQAIQKCFGTLSAPEHKDYPKYVEKLWTLAEASYPGEADAITAYVLENIGCRNIVVMNSAKEFEKNHKSATSPSTIFTVVIGGNIVSRGMTFDNLLSMYFTRDVKHKIQQDTYIQRARMFGTRDYLPYFELTIPEGLYFDWHRCFIFHRLSLAAIRNNKGAPVWLEDGRIASTSSSSIDKSTISIDAGEMGLGMFDYSAVKGSLDKVVGNSNTNFGKLKELHALLGEDHFPSFMLDFIEGFSPNGESSIMIHPAQDIKGSTSGTDQDNISRKKGFMGGALYAGNKHVNHHFRVLYNTKGKARLFYRYTGDIRFLKNMKDKTPQTKALA